MIAARCIVQGLLWIRNITTSKFHVIYPLYNQNQIPVVTRRDPCDDYGSGSHGPGMKHFASGDVGEPDKGHFRYQILASGVFNSLCDMGSATPRGPGCRNAASRRDDQRSGEKVLLVSDGQIISYVMLGISIGINHCIAFSGTLYGGAGAREVQAVLAWDTNLNSEASAPQQRARDKFIWPLKVRWRTDGTPTPTSAIEARNLVGMPEKVPGDSEIAMIGI
ncbi:hypothetical protein BJV74DRAFT_829582 [Russula compacta]|nr:hypothetical protein BJV74DRAFT_829582 [Russula compacta]